MDKSPNPTYGQHSLRVGDAGQYWKPEPIKAIHKLFK